MLIFCYTSETNLLDICIEQNRNRNLIMKTVFFITVLITVISLAFLTGCKETKSETQKDGKNKQHSVKDVFGVHRQYSKELKE